MPSALRGSACLWQASQAMPSTASPPLRSSHPLFARAPLRLTHATTRRYYQFWFSLMKQAYFDCFSGISGDMTLGALLDAGLPIEHLRTELQSLEIPGWELTAEKVWKNGMAATYAKVRTQDTQTHRSLSTILRIIEKSKLSAAVKEQSSAIFKKLGEAEATVHDVPLEKIHFHEVGAVDAIVDIVGACVGFSALGIESFACSPLNVGGGTAKMAHGVLPVPAPATARLLIGKPTLFQRRAKRTRHAHRRRHRRHPLPILRSAAIHERLRNRLRRGHR